MSPKDADGMANSAGPDQIALNSVDPDQTAPLGAVWSGSALFAQTYLSENLGSLRYVEIWYRPPNGTSEDFQLFRDQFDHIRNQHKGNKLPSVHVLGDINFKDIDWLDRRNKSGTALSLTEGKILIDIMNDHGLEQLVHFPTREKNTLDLILTSLTGQFQDIHSPDKLSDHDIISGTL